MQMNIEEVPKPSDVDADPAKTWGRLTLGRKRTNCALSKSTGALMTACWREEFCSNTGDPDGCPEGSGNMPPVRAGHGSLGSRRGPQYRRSRVTPVEGRGLGSRAMHEEAKARRLA